MEQHKQGIYEKYIKRMLDILISLTALIVLSPVFGSGSIGAHKTRRPCHFPPTASGLPRKNIRSMQIPLHDRRTRQER